MASRLAYLIGGAVKVHRPDEKRCTPRAEYEVFAQRNPVDILDYARLEASDNRVARFFLQRQNRQFGLSAMALAESNRYNGFLISGEDIGLPLAILAKLQRIQTPIYIITHGSYFASSKLRLLMAWIRTMPSVHYLCLSESLRQFMISRLNVPASNVHNTGYGADTHFFQPISLSPTPVPVVASAGTASRDYRTLVQSIADLPVDCKIAADSTWLPMQVDIADDALPPNVEARSFGNYSGLRGLYASSSFVVVPLYNVAHACGYAVIVEAMAMGKAVIATRTLNHSDFIEEGKNGYYVEAGDVATLRARIETLLHNPKMAEEMGRNARLLMENTHSVEAYCERIEQGLSIRFS